VAQGLELGGRDQPTFGSRFDWRQSLSIPRAVISSTHSRLQVAHTTVTKVGAPAVSPSRISVFLE
jgi:hypothetical protein